MNRNKPTLSVDVEYYQRFLDDPDLSDAQKKELIETLWGIVCEFVMIGFHVHPVQQAQDACGQERIRTERPAQEDSRTVESHYGALIDAFVKTGNGQEGDNADA